MSEAIILLAHVEAEAAAHCSDQCDLRTERAYVQALFHGSPTRHPCCEFDSGLPVSSSVPSLYLILFGSTISVAVPQESEHHLASERPHPRRIFLLPHWDGRPPRAQIHACLLTAGSQAPSTVPGTPEALDNVCLLKRMRSCR